MRTEVLIVGGGTGGVAAALAVAQAGVRCVLTEPTDWVGGQLTAQAVPPDENRWIDGRDGVQSATRSYLDYRQRVRRWYQRHGHLTDAAQRTTHLNPGNGWVSDLCHRPDVGHAVLRDMLSPHIASGHITLLPHHEPIGADTQGDVILSVTFTELLTGKHVTIEAEYFLDATELGDVLALAEVEHAIGAEHRDRYGELHGREDHDDWRDQQAVSWCFAMEHVPGQDHTTGKPAGYDGWASYVPAMVDRPWTGPLFSWRVPDHEGDRGRTLPMVPWPDEPDGKQWELWRYRRIVDASLHTDGSPDVTLVNWMQMDYWRKPVLHPTKATCGVDAGTTPLPPGGVPGVIGGRGGGTAASPPVSTPSSAEPPPRPPKSAGTPPEGRGVTQVSLNPASVDLDALQQAKHLSRCLLYWMQTAAPRHDCDTQVGYPGLRLRGEELGTADGFAKHCYIREARRLIAQTLITEAHVGHDQRVQMGLLKEHADAERLPGGEASGLSANTSEPFPDSVGIGHYRLDLHPSPAGRNSVYVRTGPFRIPMGALIPVRVRNLLAAGKCLGVTHVTNGCYRLHPIEWNVGEAAGTLAGYALAHGLTPAAVRADPARLADYQSALTRRGVALRWPWEAA